jgi:hypothetical protein
LVKFDGNGDTGFEGVTAVTYGVLQHGTERQRLLCSGRRERDLDILKEKGM